MFILRGDIRLNSSVLLKHSGVESRITLSIINKFNATDEMPRKHTMNLRTFDSTVGENIVVDETIDGKQSS